MPSVIDGDGSHQFFKGIDRPEPLADRLESTRRRQSCCRKAVIENHSVIALFLLQEQRRLLAQYRKKAFCYLRQEPRQRQFDAQRVVHHFNARRRSLAERAHAEAQCISFPSLLLHRDHGSEVSVGAGEALFETADRFDPPETMVDGDCDGVAHGNGSRVVWTCMRAIMIEGRQAGVG